MRSVQDAIATISVSRLSPQTHNKPRKSHHIPVYSSHAQHKVENNPQSAAQQKHHRYDRNNHDIDSMLLLKWVVFGASH